MRIEQQVHDRTGDLGDLLTTAQVAELLGVKVRAVQALAKRRGVGRRVGAPPHSVLLFTPADVEALRDRKVGRPRKPA